MNLIIIEDKLSNGMSPFDNANGRGFYNGTYLSKLYEFEGAQDVHGFSMSIEYFEMGYGYGRGFACGQGALNGFDNGSGPF